MAGDKRCRNVQFGRLEKLGENTDVSPEEAVAEAARRGCKGFTYCKNSVILGQ